ncbi:MAG: hypothetical protein ACI90V_006595 [Bacillariaceae sp.]|jgi:hypothetical protein
MYQYVELYKSMLYIVPSLTFSFEKPFRIIGLKGNNDL